MNGEKSPKIAPEIIWHTMDDNAVGVTPKVGKVRVFNGPGTLIWHMLAADKTLTAIHESLVDTYEVTPAEAYHDLESFIAELTERGLLVW